jgi:hypothetical protein
MADVRQRKKPADEKTVSPETLKKEDGTGIPYLDILRTLIFILLASSALSYFITRESFFWGVKRPQWSRIDVLKAKLVRPLPLPSSFPSPCACLEE